MFKLFNDMTKYGHLLPNKIRGENFVKILKEIKKELDKKIEQQDKSISAQQKEKNNLLGNDSNIDYKGMTVNSFNKLNNNKISLMKIISGKLGEISNSLNKVLFFLMINIISHQSLTGYDIV